MATEKLKAALTDAYIALLRLNASERVYIQAELCALRDRIAELDRVDSELVQNSHEAVACEYTRLREAGR